MIDLEAAAQEIGSRIREARTLADLQQKELADLLGVHFTRVSCWERGVDLPSTARLIELATALHVAPGWLLSGSSGDGIHDATASASAQVKEGKPAPDEAA